MKQSIVLVLLLVLLLVLPLAKADSIGVWKSYDASSKTYTIGDSFGLRKVVNITLLRNTDTCFDVCEAELLVTPYINFNTNAIPSDYIWKFLNRLRQEQVISHELQLLRTYQVEHSYTCLYDFNYTTNPKTATCYRYINYGNHTQLEYLFRGSFDRGNISAKTIYWNTTEKAWDNINFYNQELRNDRTYQIKIVGYKEPTANIEWIPRFYSTELDEWAWWNATVDYKRELYFNTTSSTAVRVPYLVNGTQMFGGSEIWTLPQEAFSTATNYSEYLYYNSATDVYVINTSENQQLSHDIVGYASYNPASVWTSAQIYHVFHFNNSVYNSTGGTPNSNAVSYNSSGVFGSALDMHNTATYLNLGNFKENTAYAYEFWLWLDACPAANYKRINFNYPGMTLSINTDCRGYIDTYGKFFYVPAFPTGVWHHVVMQTKGGVLNGNATLQVYVNGTLSVQASHDNYEYAGALYIGGESSNSLQTGKLDELRIWNKSLSADEVKTLYEQGKYARSSLGEESNIRVGVSLISPENNLLTQQRTHNFTCNATGLGGIEINNITTYIWNVTNEVSSYVFDVSGNFSEVGYNYALPHLGAFTWNCFAQDTTGVYTDWGTNRTITFQNLTITLGVPINAYDSTLTSIFFNATKNDGGSLELDNATIYIYNSSSLFYSNTNTSVVNDSSWTVTSIVPGKYTWGVKGYTSDNHGTSSNRTFYIQANVTSVTYNATVYETETTTIRINFTAVEDITPTIKLYYDHVEKTPTTTNISNNYTSIYSFDAPLSPGQHGFYFNITEGDYVQSTTNSTQLIIGLNLSLCMAGNKVPYINISYRNESTTMDWMNASVPSSAWNYWLGSGTIYKPLSYSTATEKTNHSFCMNASYASLKGNISYSYSATSYPQRQWMDTFTLTNTTTQKTLWLLGTADGIYVTFQVINLAEQSLQDVYVTANRTIGSASEFIEGKHTGTDGAATFWLNPNYQHIFVFNKTGYTVYTMSIYPTQGAYTVTLGGGAPENITEYSREIVYYFYPKLSSLQNSTAYDFIFNIKSGYYTLEKYGFQLTNDSGTVLGSASGTTGIGGNATLNYNTGNQTRIYMKWYYAIEGNYTNGTKWWYVATTYESDFSILDLFQDVNLLLSHEVFGGHGSFTKIIITFFIIFMITGVLCYISGIYSPLMIMAMITSLATFASYPSIGLIEGIFPHWAILPIILGMITIAIGVWEYGR